MDFLIYLLKSGTILILFYTVYRLVLQKDTFFTANRFYLLSGITAAVFLPLVEFTKEIIITAPAVVGFTSALETPTIATVLPQAMQEDKIFSTSSLLLWIYGIGVTILIIRFLYQLSSVILLIKKAKPIKKNGFVYRAVQDNIAPFTFFNTIVYNPNNHTIEELEMVIKHEEVHALQWHSLDIVLANLVTIFQWINPFSWSYKKSIEENLEYLADTETISQVASKKEYQLALVKASSAQFTPALTSNFYQSFIKKRIVMLNTHKSESKNLWKLSYILPVLALFLWSFNTKEKVTYVTDTVTPYLVSSTTSNKELKKLEKQLALDANGLEVRFTDVLRNSSEEITQIAIETRENAKESFIKNATYGGTNTAPIQAIKMLITNGNELQFGSENDDFVLRSTKQGVITDIVDNTLVSKLDGTSKIEFTITKTSTDEELEKIKSILKDNYKVSLSFTKIDRNAANEIIELKAKIKSKNSSSNFHESCDDGIKPIRITYDEKSGNLFIGNSASAHFIHKNKKGNHVVIDIDEDGENSKVWISKDGKNISKSESGTYEYIIKSSDNGTEEEIRIHTNSLNEGEHENFIFLGEDNDDHPQIKVFSSKNNQMLITEDGKEPLILIDGKESSKEAFEKLDKKNIKTIEVLKGDNVVKEYGKKAKDGVIIVTTN